MILKNFKKASAFILGLFVSIGCEDILFVEDISGKEVVILAPLNNTVVSSGTTNFSWEPIADADSYQLQLATPSFENATQIILDTLVRKRSFSKELLKEKYQWRLRAVNSGYVTAYTNSQFSVSESEDFETNTLLLTAPIENLETNIIQQDLTWATLEGATEYRLQVWSPDTNGTLILDEQLTKTNSTVTFEQGTFSWQVRGQNSTQNTLYTSRSLIVDTTAPNAVTNITPANNATLNETNIEFTWGRTDIVGATEIDSLFVFTDAALSTLSFKEQGTAKSYEKELTIGTYYWVVKSYDTAGNSNTQSDTFLFKLN